MAEQFNLFAESEDSGQDVPDSASSEPRTLFFDLETQKSAGEVGGWSNSHLMKLAVGVVWDSREKEYFTFLEDQADQLAQKLRSADLVVGFNVIGFDYSVLQPYASFDLHEINTFDMLIDVHKKLGFRVSLNHLAQHTLKAEKSADGLLSLQWYKEGKIDKIVEYCKKDVEITRDLFLFGEKNGFVNYESRDRGVQKLPVDWKVAQLIGTPATDPKRPPA
ncbi:MAG: ribonuclease H-like domain-containing protein [Nitrospinae bacterium]|nr:ribonuclease H-like domain-containing protein [Nitrospinota bacterium]